MSAQRRDTVIAITVGQSGNRVVLERAAQRVRQHKARLLVLNVEAPLGDDAAKSARRFFDDVGQLTGLEPSEYDVLRTGGAALDGRITAFCRLSEPLMVIAPPGKAGIAAAKRSTCPVLLVRECPRGAVVAATDLADPGLPAITFASAEAMLYDRRLCLFHAISAVPPDNRRLSIDDWLHGIASAPEANAVRSLLAHHAARIHGFAEVCAAEGEPVSLLRRLVRHLPAELVVLSATQRRGRIAAAMHDCFIDRFVECAPCSVLVVPKGKKAGFAAASA